MISLYLVTFFSTILSFLVFPIVFWVLLAIEVVGLIYATEEESLFGAFTAIVFGTGLGILEFGTFSGFLTAITHNPLIVVGLFIAYFILGTVWSRFKWGMFVSERAEAINEFITVYGRDSAILTYSTYKNGEKNTQEIIDTNFACLAPNVGNNKKKITTWIILWIPSLAWFLLSDPLRRIANWIFNSIKAYFQGVSEAIFKKSFKINSEEQK